MSDIIQLLPDHIANQIAAGEVIQRPASVVKELLENAIDAQSTEIKLIIKDSGKTLIQVIDNGSGMSPSDARMAFERHATSKITNANDLFSIQTKGFRGEALASIAAIAHVELITRRSSEDVAHRLVINGSKIEKQEVIQSAVGSSFAIKNLFFNVPARRKFLKSDPVELRHVMDEFHRVALAHPEIHFSLINNGNEVYYLTPGNIKQRIVAIQGKSYDAKLLPVNESTEFIQIEGFVTKAENAKKNNAEQFLFVNKRFIKSHYLNHAIKMAYDTLLQKDQYPGFFLFLSIDPAKIDVNVHPTKTEIKFEEESLIYNYLRVSVKHALGKYVVAPTLDFDLDTNFVTAHSNTRSIDKSTSSWSPKSYQDDASKLQKENLKSWDKIYENISSQAQTSPQQQTLHKVDDTTTPIEKEPYQLHQSYILSHIKSGYLIIDQQAAHERIMYENTLKSLKEAPASVQKELFPIQISLSTARSQMVEDIIPYLNKVGFEIGAFGKNTFVIHGTPAHLPKGTSAEAAIEGIIGQYEQQLEFQLGIEENLARSMAKVVAIKKGKLLSLDEMRSLINDLFACETPFSSPSGKKTFITHYIEVIEKQFG